MFWYTNIYEMNIGISHISFIISVSLLSWLLMNEGIYIDILIAPYEHIKNIILILNSTGWFLVLVILIPIVDLIICVVREWISFDFYYTRVWIIGCLWEWMYQIVYLILVLCLLNGIDDELMICNDMLHWSSFRSNSYGFIYILWSATDYTG